jgi:hypothetical protein
MRILGVFCLFALCILLQSCNSLKAKNKLPEADSLYVIKSIDSINNWYTVYVCKKDSIYKIVAKKEDHALKCKTKIRVGKSYQLKLHSKKVEAPVINGVKIQPVNFLDMPCYTYDEKTVICIDPKNGIYDLYYTPNIRGLCYVPSGKSY